MQALEGFAKKVVEQNLAIYNNETFNQIISMYSTGQMDQSLAKIQSLISFLTFGQNERYLFDDLELREKKNAKLNNKIEQVTGKVMAALEELFVEIQNKNTLISKI